MRCLASLALAGALIVPATTQAQARDPTPPLPTVTLPAELNRVLRDYESSWQNKDVPQLTGLFTDDGFVLSNTRAPVRGRPEIAKVYQSAGGGLWLRALGYSVGDSVGYIVGAYGYGAAPPVPDVGKFVLALRRGPGGQWLIAADIDNTNQR